MVSMTLFDKSKKISEIKSTKLAKPKKEPSIKSPSIDNLKNMMLERQIIELADKDNMPADEPLRLIHTMLARQIDAFGAAIKGFGPDAGRLAGEEAGRVTRQEMRRLSWKIDGLRAAVLAGCGLVFLGAGVTGGWIARGRSLAIVAGSPMPQAMAERMPLQSWPSQWQACQAQPPRGGYEWCLLPFVTKPPDFEK